jgi:hypothetical protein
MSDLSPELEWAIADLRHDGVQVAFVDHMRTPGLWLSKDRIVILATDQEDWRLVSACKSVLDGQVDTDKEGNWLGEWREAKPAKAALEQASWTPTPRLTPEQRAAEVRAAVEQAKAFIASAGDEGALLNEVRQDLFLFNFGTIEDAIKLLRLSEAVSESREKRPAGANGRAGMRSQIVLRVRGTETP